MLKEKKAAIIAVIFILIVLLLSAASLFSMNYYTKNEAKIARIYQDGTLLYTIDLDAVTESQELTIHGENGAYNVILVEPGYISMKEASCPDHLCVHMGKISTAVLPITCLPNKVVISIWGNSPDSLDSIAY
ncbi:MAG: NusG domain II-containing protein [Thermoflexaceae bacterium]|nr:NusG domain II-containing protein [Thermoflexaceae bacterium]